MAEQADIQAFTDGDPLRQRRLDRLAELADEELPAVAQDSDEKWPVHLDHCFRRLAYDCAVDTEWTDKYERPFTDHATTADIGRAVSVLCRLKADGPEYAWFCQEKSLLYRGKLDPDDAEHIDPEWVREHEADTG